MARKNQLRQSAARLQKQGLLFYQHTRNAGETFAADSRDASAGFVTEMGAASRKLVGTTTRSASHFGNALQKEATTWRDLALQTPGACLAALKGQVGRAEILATDTREALRPEAVETLVLKSAHDLLESAQSRIDGRLKQTPKPAKPAQALTRPKAVKAPRKGERAPIRNYDRLTAKDVVNRIQRLSGQQATAVLNYEQARKKRATVIRAAKQRLAAS